MGQQPNAQRFARMRANSCFDSVRIGVLREVVEESLQDYHGRNGSAESPESLAVVREKVARAVMSQALRGECDPGRLKQAALAAAEE